MTNEEFKNKNNELLAQITSKEMNLAESIKAIIPDVKVPVFSVTFSSKINELLNLFDKQGCALERQLTVILTSQFLFSRYVTYLQSVNVYMMEILNSLKAGNENALRDLLSKKDEEETLWENFNDEILNYDFRNDLGTLLDSGISIPANKSKDEAYNICMSELNSIGYVPKRQSEVKEQNSPKYLS